MTKHYYEIKLPNVVMEPPERPPTETREYVVGTNVVMHPFIELLAVKHPEWRFVGIACNSRVADATDAVAFVYRKFEVLSGKQSLGFLYSEYSYGRRKDMYVIQNHRTEKTLSRASAVKTSDLKKAINHVEKLFFTLTSREMVEIKLTEASMTLQDLISTKAQQQRNAERHVTQYVREYIRAHKEAVMFNIPDQADRDRFLKVFILEDEVKVLEAAHSVVTLSGGHRIMQQGDIYYEVGNGGELVQHTADTLSDSIRHKLGILKLVEDGQAVEGVGFRQSSEMFILFGDNNER